MKNLYLLFYAILISGLSFGQVTLTILDGPANGSTVIDDPETATPGNANIDFTTTNFDMSEDLNPVDGVPDTATGEGYIIWFVENRTDPNPSNYFQVTGGSIFTSNDPGTTYDVVGLVNGETYFLRSELVDNNGDPLGNPVVYSFTITISSYIDVANLAALRIGTPDPDTYYRVTGQVINTNTIDIGSGRTMYFQDSFGGIKVYDPDYASSSYSMGDVISNIRGHLEILNGELSFIPTYADWGSPFSSGGTPFVQSASINDLISNWSAYESELVKISAATFVDAGNTFILNNNYSINDGSGSANFNTGFSNADYLLGGQNTIPSGSQDIVSIVTGSSITARNSSDMTSNPLSSNDFEIDSFKMYPNPTSIGYITLSSKNEVIMSVSLFDLLGKQVLSKMLSKKILDVSNVPAGIYILHVIQDDAISARKLVIK